MFGELVLLAFFVAPSALLVVSGDVRPRWLVVLVVGSFALAAVGAVGWLLETVARWWWSRRRPGTVSLGTAPSGTAATVVLRSRAALVTPWAFAVLLPAWGLGMAVLSTPIPWLSVVFGLLGAAVTLRLLPLLLGRATAGGLFLTPSGVEHRFGVVTTVLPWEGFTVPAVEVPLQVARYAGVTERRAFPADMPVDVTEQVPAGQVRVPAPYLVLPADDVVDLLTMYAAQPHLRAYLGSDRSLDWQPWKPGAVTSTGGDSG